ncbi:glutamine amidotransferase [Curtobacterium sp. PhB130]|uniref:class II glutamine amidotransferase n=1 Tax=unclassified Curtobacterium TaxID=257496 RepID=UPI000F4B7F5A|nr:MULTISPECIES: class II glutamine amidotransferase [unclassified Curtobacterium]ROS77412.1 glutamine amidotransferase [Curtobacterium sp. PhB130]TCK66381.1 glutamine amidotransferase [Curtobacterium sp. PhB136]
MCRWLGYVGDPIEPRELLYDTERSLIEQSRFHSPETPAPNGDGTGLGWYGRREQPTLFRSAAPAWGDENLRELASEVASGLFLAHVRAATGTPVQETNSHPFRYGRWLFVHNGFIKEFAVLRRELLMAVRADLFPCILGSTDSELMFFLALTFGLEEDPIGGLERMAGFVESVAADAGIDGALQMTIGLTDGRTLTAVRYASAGPANTLFVSSDVGSVRQLYPEVERLSHLPENARVVVSEPLVALPGLWREVPAGSAVTIGEHTDERPFVPTPPR